MKYFLKQAEYYEFVQWIATPEPFRRLQTQQDFQREHKISHDTLARWKHDPNFWEDVRRVWEGKAKERTASVIEALYLKIVKKPDPISIELWMKLIEGFTPQSGQVQPGIATVTPELSDEQKKLLDQAITYAIPKPAVIIDADQGRPELPQTTSH